MITADGSAQGQGPWDQTNKLLAKSYDSERYVELVVQMVKALTQTVRGAGSGPAQSYILFTLLL